MEGTVSGSIIGESNYEIRERTAGEAYLRTMIRIIQSLIVLLQRNRL